MDPAKISEGQVENFKTYSLVEIDRSFDVSSENANCFHHLDNFQLIWNVLGFNFQSSLSKYFAVQHGTNNKIQNLRQASSAVGRNETSDGISLSQFLQK